MKSLLPIILIGLILLSSVSIHALPQIINTDISKEITITKSTTFSPPIISSFNTEYSKIDHPDTDYFQKIPGAPVIPKITYYYELPFGATHINIDVDIDEIHEQILTEPIHPAVAPNIMGLQSNIVLDTQEKDPAIYNSNKPYPNTWFTSSTGCGKNSRGNHVTHLTITIFPVQYLPLAEKIQFIKSAEITIRYNKPENTPFPLKTLYDLVIIAPEKFSTILQKLIEHKENLNIPTLLKTTEDIYSEYTGVDKPEQIKKFIKDAVETYNTKNILLIGGLKSFLYTPPRDDPNQGSKGWYVPVRYSNHYDDDPGFLCDLYYADIYKTGGIFDDWDSNDDGIIGARDYPGFSDDEIDLYPDVSVGRFPCRTLLEVKSIVDKIITYESTPIDPSWFNKIVAIAGDGLQDQTDLNIEWNVTTLPNDEYTLFAQSKSQITGTWGPIDNITITLDHDAESNITFSEDDHLRINTYPGPAIAEITSPSQGNILGNTDVDFLPKQAYMGETWARVEYIDGIMHIRGKSYDPRPYGFYTDIKFWIEDSIGSTILTQERNTTRVYMDCEWTSGNRPLGGDRAGAFYYMPDTFEKNFLWASSGNFTSQQDVIDTLSQGCGFAFFFGHASPSTMVVNLPGMPGGFRHSAITGLEPMSLSPPFFPMNKIKNTDKLPIVAVMGCHNSQYNITMLRALTDPNNIKKTWVYGFPLLECWSWWITKMPQRGAIATIGCTALGPGEFDENFVPDTGCWIFPELFRQYGEEKHEILGAVFDQTLTSYLNIFGQDNFIDAKMVQELALFGDPSLLIGGYS
jgi:hypothetical protein